ncbi:MAG: B12-binding domain-containing radical SAM protein [Spirochaetales bacterium]|nr:B12-binding domain-containing radical SAM protein [Spirochaetales bacterium]
MKLLLVMPGIYDTDRRLIKNNIMPSIVLYTLASLCPDFVELTIVDENVDQLDITGHYDVVGISVNTLNVIRAYELGDYYRSKRITVILGGIHTSLVPEEARLHGDAIVIGEAETVFPLVLEDCKKGTLQTMYTSQVPVHPDAIPTPRYDLIDFSKYLKLPTRKGPMIPVYISRGCPHDCSFCASTKFWGRNVRYRKTEQIIEDMKKSGSDTFFLIDDNFASNPKKMEEISSALIPLHIRYFAQLDTTIAKHPELIPLLKKSGLYLAYIGFESIHLEDQALIKKQFNKPEVFSNILSLFQRNNINVYASIIFGLENDSLEKMRKTVDFFIERKTSIALFTPLTPYPGTRLYDEMKQKKEIVDEGWWLKLEMTDPLVSLVAYKDKMIDAAALCSDAMKLFYSWASIFRRFFPRGLLNRFSMFFLNVRLRWNYSRDRRFTF